MLKKFKRFYRYNRIYCILMFICLFCFLLMGTGIIVYFIDQTSTSKYGDRLNGIDDFNQDEIVKNLENSFNDAKILEKDIYFKGRIIYISLTVEKTTTNEDIQTMCTSSLSAMDEDVKGFFDIQYIAKREGYASYMGSKNHTKTTITWGNYSFEEATSTTTTTKKK